MNMYLLGYLGNKTYKFGTVMGQLPGNRRYQKKPNLSRSEDYKVLMPLTLELIFSEITASKLSCKAAEICHNLENN